jgi:hypothetical protein
MANFAVITGNVVSNIIVADTRDTAELVTGQLCTEIPEGVAVNIGNPFEPETETPNNPVK